MGIDTIFNVIQPWLPIFKSEMYSLIKALLKQIKDSCEMFTLKKISILLFPHEINNSSVKFKFQPVPEYHYVDIFWS